MARLELSVFVFSVHFFNFFIDVVRMEDESRLYIFLTLVALLAMILRFREAFLKYTLSRWIPYRTDECSEPEAPHLCVVRNARDISLASPLRFRNLSVKLLVLCAPLSFLLCCYICSIPTSATTV